MFADPISIQTPDVNGYSHWTWWLPVSAVEDLGSRLTEPCLMQGTVGDLELFDLPAYHENQETIAS